MGKSEKRRSRKAGMPPGSLVYIGKRKIESTIIRVFDYCEKGYEEYRADSIGQCLMPVGDGRIRWINVDGLHEVEILEKLGECYGLHPLVMEDILNTDQRPKLEDYGDYLYIVARMIYFEQESDKIVMEQQSIVLGKNFVISFGEREGDVFEPIRERIRSGTGKVRKSGADYLAYSLMDAIVDGYFAVLERLGDTIEEAEEKLIANPTNETLGLIRGLKRDMLHLHKSIWPLREVASAMERGESPLIQEATQVYVRDVYDHIIQSMDTTETFRDILSGMMDIYLSSLSNRMNEVMRVLTVISTIFMPLTFIAGVYGMNFKHMPELEWKWGYFAVLVLMFGTAGAMILYFKKKRWL